jgi:TonB family protein
MENSALQGILNQPQPGFYRVLLVSLVLHAVAITAGLLLVKGEPSRVLYAPVYTTVDLVAAPPVKPKPRKKIKKVKKKTPAKAVKKTPAPKKPAPKKPATIKTRATPPPPAKPTPDKSAEDKIFVSEKIKDIEKKSRQREEEMLVTSRIEDIKKKAEEEKERLEALTLEIAEEEEIKKHIEELKKELESAESETRTVEAEPPPTTPSARAAPGSIRRELLDLEHKAYYNKVGSMVQSLWVYPGAAEGLDTVLSIKIARSGELKKVVVEKRSGNALFDESAKRAVKKAAPFPPLPEGLGGDFLDLGLRFCPGGCYQLL